MTLQEVLKLQKPDSSFRRPYHTNWLWVSQVEFLGSHYLVSIHGKYNLSVDDVLATDWFIKQDEITEHNHAAAWRE